MADDEGPGVYQGLGYMVELEKYIDAEYGVCIRSIEMRMFGQVITASITDRQMVQEETISQMEEDTLQEELTFSTGETTQKQIFLNPKEMTVEI
ncbi:MAG: hypothetical protein IKJ01_09605 [Lachnospiraceae bacterium]|nr:hypothetical protein [Lachnospiraceae bacterium]